MITINVDYLMFLLKTCITVFNEEIFELEHTVEV